MLRSGATHSAAISLIASTTASCGGDKQEDLLQPLANVVAKRGCRVANLETVLQECATNLALCRDTFGGIGQARPTPRDRSMDDDLRERLRGHGLREALLRTLIGQTDGVLPGSVHNRFFLRRPIRRGISGDQSRVASVVVPESSSISW